MSLTDKLLHLAELVVLCLCIILMGINSMKAKNRESELNAEISALRYEVKESEERCKRLSYTCIDVVNRKILEGADYDGD